MSPLTIPLASERGQELLEDIKQDCQPFQPLIYSVYCKQKVRNACGIHSCGLLLNAAYVAKAALVEGKFDAKDLPYSERKMIHHELTTRALLNNNVLSSWAHSGVTLEQVGDILNHHGCKVECYHVSQSSKEEFIRRTTEALSKRNLMPGIIANFDRIALGQKYYSGHHSPIGGYHYGEDLFLILDTGSEPAFWVPSDVLFHAMNTIDKCSKKTRGYLIVEVPENLLL